MASLSYWFKIFGFDPRRAVGSVRGIARYLRDLQHFKAGTGADFRWAALLPVLDERLESSGGLGAYFHQDLLVARWIYQDMPPEHTDVGSRLDGFIGHLAVFREVVVLDIRPQAGRIRNIVFQQLDLMEELPNERVESVDSLSCLHTVEHFGLGRYGDTIDPNGHEKGLAQLKRMVKPGGLLYLSTLIGPQRIEFNAHRVFSTETFLSWFGDGWDIERFAYLDDSECLHEDVDPKDPGIMQNFDCLTGLGIAAARKRIESPSSDLSP